MTYAPVLATPATVHLSLTSGRWQAGAIALVMLEAALASAVLLSGPARIGGLVAVGAVSGALAAGLLSIPAGLIGATEASHVALYGTLLAIFACSLRGGREAVVTRLARQVRGSLPPEIVTYTRRVTLAWCLFFAALIVASTTLLAFAPRTVWSLFVNVLDLPLVVVMFLAEYACRRILFRHLPHRSVFASARSAMVSRAS